jgi:hypothetical protein
MVMDKKPKYDIYRKVLEFHCLRQTGFPKDKDWKTIGVKPGVNPTGPQYYLWLSGDPATFANGEGLGIAVDTFTGTHLKGRNQSPRNTGYIRLIERLGLDLDNPTTDEERQAIWEIQAAFGIKPTVGFYKKELDERRKNIMAENANEIEGIDIHSFVNHDSLPKIDFRQ